ncbi:glycine betaine ABC transporter substrate-binding protein [Streptomyces sp. RFCAC02]|uniref:glycine betaine ABC transporter substrate-binding protein n=1 Tax=Streptomyces sp. RFCAC02 TaxID=2499143 RepID=UPI001020ADFA|nr:glycine betaine ABC transporter substrate-binding protein [Streptomyces sp. RFCAC02]
MRRIRQPLLAGVGILSLLATSGCVFVDRLSGGGAAEEADPVRIAVPEWPGGVANAAVAAYVLEYELGVPVEKVYVSQDEAWEGLGSGDIEAVLEDWGALPDARRLYVEGRETAVDAGPLGITGHVGWYVAGGDDLTAEHPEALDWRHLNDYADEFGGELLHADPAYTTRDDAIIADLGLDYRTVTAGSEEALVDRLADAGTSGRPVLAYFWEPHWLAGEVDLAEVRLPDYYPSIELRKYLNAEFAEDGGEAAAFLRAFSWSEEDQNAVAALMEHDHLSPTAAAERWVDGHPDEVAAWLDAARA